MYSKSPKAKRIEFRCPDPTCNPYLAFSAMLMAGLDGIAEQDRAAATPVDKNLYDLPPEELAKIPQVPGSLDEALDALEADHDFLLEGGVFTQRPDRHVDLEYKRENEIDAVAPAPAPVGVLPLLRHLISASARPSRRPPTDPITRERGARGTRCVGSEHSVPEIPSVQLRGGRALREDLPDDQGAGMQDTLARVQRRAGLRYGRQVSGSR